MVSFSFRSITKAHINQSRISEWGQTTTTFIVAMSLENLWHQTKLHTGKDLEWNLNYVWPKSLGAEVTTHHDYHHDNDNLQTRSDQSRWVQRSRSEDKNLIPWQQHLVIFNKVFILSFYYWQIFNKVCFSFFIGQSSTRFFFFIIGQSSTRFLFPFYCRQFWFSSVMMVMIMIWPMGMVAVQYNDSTQTKILKNQEGCVNTLSMECMDFYHRF